MPLSIFQGDRSRWALFSKVSNRTAFIKSKKKGLVYLPEKGWQFRDGGWKADDTLTVTGKKTSCQTLNNNIDSEDKPTYPEKVTMSSIEQHLFK